VAALLTHQGLQAVEPAAKHRLSVRVAALLTHRGLQAVEPAACALLLSLMLST